MATPDEQGPPPAFDVKMLERLWPNRNHESNWLKDLICALGLHRWYALELSGTDGTLSCRFCRWCTKVKVLNSGARIGNHLETETAHSSSGTIAH